MNECEHVIVVDLCCTIKRPTTMCLAKKTPKKQQHPAICHYVLCQQLSVIMYSVSSCHYVLCQQVSVIMYSVNR